MARIKTKIDMAITRTQLINNYGFRVTKDNKKVLTRKLGKGDTIDIFGNALFFEGKLILTLEWMSVDTFGSYLEKMISTIKRKHYAERKV